MMTTTLPQTVLQRIALRKALGTLHGVIHKFNQRHDDVNARPEQLLHEEGDEEVEEEVAELDASLPKTAIEKGRRRCKTCRRVVWARAAAKKKRAALTD